MGKIVTAVITGAGAYAASAKAFSYVISKIPGVGMVIGSGVNAAVTALVTLWFAYGLIDLFAKTKA